MKVRDVIKRIEANGWYLARVRGDHRHYLARVRGDHRHYLARVRGDHRHYKHPTKKGIVTVSGHPGKDMPVGTLLSVFKQAQIEKEE